MSHSPKSENVTVRLSPLWAVLIICFFVPVAFVSLTSCATSRVLVPTPVSVSVHEACGIDPDAWSQIPTPSQRDILLESKNIANEEPVRKFFVTSTSEIETWFENADRDVLGCRYLRQENCGGGLFTVAIFAQHGGAWKLKDTFSSLCAE